ncbi:nucleoside triphosphate pyrophosphatase [Nevskia sp.]|uniref:Maf family protein n=1 Tax=Nevskia sp. TaxID=1929292 RepID=UPI0025F3BF57|nr:nucleoside triphosphate pyrophosphatase [Nevskia sp.]
MSLINSEFPLILASGSRYRASLLARLGLPFVAMPSDADESRQPGETPLQLAERLAIAKARVLSSQHPERWVLGSDQVAALGDSVLGKPGNRERAIAQLRAQAGNTVIFITAVALIHEASGRVLRHVDHTRVRFRHLSDAEIERYLDAEPAYDCAGSFKSEGLGISLVEAIASEDATGLVGLPLIAVRRMLAEAGCALP